MLTRTRNTLEAVEDASDRLATAWEDQLKLLNATIDTANQELVAELRSTASTIRRTAVAVEGAAHSHRQAMDLVESIAWTAVTAVLIWYAWDVGKEMVGLFRD